MKIEVITQATKVEIKRIIQNALDGGYPIEFEGVYPNMIEEALEEIGIKLDEGYDFNGWQCDYWIKFLYKNEWHRVFGEAWYGRVVIEKDEEE